MKGETINIEDTIMSEKCKCEGCRYNDQTYGKRIWNCTHPIPAENREISEYGCKQGSKKIMICEICEKPVHPLDTHFGRLKGELITTHIDCWNNEISNIVEKVYYKRLIEEYGLWYGPEMTATIIKEAHSYNGIHRKDLNIKFYWKDVAKDLGVSPKTISRIITGKGFPSRELMDKLVKYLDLAI